MATGGMRVNLLKNRRVLSEKDYLREKKFLQGAVIGTIIVVFVTVAMAIWNFALSQRLNGIETEITQTSAQLQGLAEANAEQVYVKNRLGLIGNFLDEQAVARESLQKILALALPGVAIGGLTFESENEIVITVSAETQSALGAALSYYQDSESYFPQVVSQGVTRNMDGSYSIKLLLTLPSEDKT